MRLFQRSGGDAALARDRADARRQEDDVALWRDYHSFLKAQQTLLSVKIAEARPSFERSGDLEADAETAQAKLNVIPASLRALFQWVVDERAELVQAQLETGQRSAGGARARQLDPDELERITLAELLAEAEGVPGHTQREGFGHFPRGAAGDVRWYGLEVADLVAAPTAASYSVNQEGDERRRALKTIGYAVGALLLFITSWVWSHRGDAASAPAQQALALVNGASVELWPIQQVALVRSNGATTTLEIQATDDALWPMPAGTYGLWRRTALDPLQLCLPADQLQDLVSITLIGTGIWPERRYSITTARPQRADLQIEPCTADTQRQPARYGLFQEAPPLTSYELGQAVTLPQAQVITVDQVELLGPAQDPLLPEGQGRVTVTLDTPEQLDWPAYAPTLLLADGTSYLPSEITTNQQGAELRYLVPLPSSDRAVAWELTPPDTHRTLRWRVTLAQPPSRAELLRTTLHVQAADAWHSPDGLLNITITVLNRGRLPLQLTPQDLTLRQGDQPLVVPELIALATPLAPEEQRTLEIPLTLRQLQPPIIISIAGTAVQFDQLSE